MDTPPRVINLVNAAQSQIIVATLIATVTFAAGFTVPGSYETNSGQDQPKGAPILLKHGVFKVFIVTDTIAFISSFASIFGYVVMTEEATTKMRDGIIKKLYIFAGRLLLLALAATVIAFVSGVYSALAHSTAIAVFVVLSGLVFLPLVAYAIYWSA